MTGAIYLGIDYGGTGTKLLLAGLADGELHVIRHDTIATPRGADALEELATEIRVFLGVAEPVAMGVSIAGIVNETTGVVVTSTNLPWLDGLSPAGVLGAKLGILAVPVHDGHSAARAEAVLGAGRGHDDIFVLALGTGIAGAHIVDGRLRRGAHGAAGEIGHISRGEGRLCSCGQRGCLESEIGGAQLARRWAELQNDAGRPMGSVPPTARDLAAAADAGDGLAIGLLDAATSSLAQGLLGLIALNDPGLIVIGGGLSGARRWIVDPVVEKVRDRATFHRLPEIVLADLAVWAGSWGAVLAAVDASGALALDLALAAPAREVSWPK